MKTTTGAFALTMMLAAGCTSERMEKVIRADAVPMSSFLPKHELLVRQPDTFPFHFFYLNEDVSEYEHVYIAPVNVDHLKKSEGWAKFDEAMAGKLGTEISDICDFMRKAYRQAFDEMEGGSRLKAVDRRDLPKTLVLEPAIIAIKPTKAELAVVGTAANLALPGIGIVATTASSGSITVECRVKDARTGTIVAMYADTENDPAAVLPIAKFTWTSSARINIKTIAAQTAKVLSAKDYRTIRRDFPIRFISRIKDADL